MSGKSQTVSNKKQNKKRQPQVLPSLKELLFLDFYVEKGVKQESDYLFTTSDKDAEESRKLTVSIASATEISWALARTCRQKGQEVSGV